MASSYDFLKENKVLDEFKRTRSETNTGINKVFQSIYEKAGIPLTDEIKRETNNTPTNSILYNQYIGELAKDKGFLRIITQNMHCRSDPMDLERYRITRNFLVRGEECNADTNFKDNQKERARGFAELIKKGGTRADIIAIQELQQPAAYRAFTERINDNLSSDNDEYDYAMLDNTCSAPICPVNLVPRYLTSGVYAESGQSMVYNKKKLEEVETQFLQFPNRYSSGIDTGVVAGVGLGSDIVGSFKGVYFSRFRMIHSPSNQHVWVFNIHPSPWLNNVGNNDERDTDILISHLVQAQLVAEKIKEYQNKREYANDAYITCGDFNINKYLENGVKYNYIPDDLKKYFGVGAYPSLDDEKFDKEEKLRANTSIHENDRIMHNNKIYERERGDDEEVIISDVDRKYYINYELKELDESKQIEIKQTLKDDSCFRDDVPYIPDPKCNGIPLLSGSEYTTVMEILESCPPIHLKSICEDPANEINPPFDGKYSWDSYHNSVLSSPLWDEPAFQLIDHIVYSKRGKIPLYAHTMVKRYILPTPVKINEGPLSKRCRDGKKGTTAEKDISITAQSFYMKDEEIYYVDIADHYAVECILIISDLPGSIGRIKNIVHPNRSDTQSVFTFKPTAENKYTIDYFKDAYIYSFGDRIGERIKDFKFDLNNYKKGIMTSAEFAEKYNIVRELLPKIWPFMSKLTNDESSTFIKLLLELPLSTGAEPASVGFQTTIKWFNFLMMIEAYNRIKLNKIDRFLMNPPPKELNLIELLIRVSLSPPYTNLYDLINDGPSYASFLKFLKSIPLTKDEKQTLSKNNLDFWTKYFMKFIESIYLLGINGTLHIIGNTSDNFNDLNTLFQDYLNNDNRYNLYYKEKEIKLLKSTDKNAVVGTKKEFVPISTRALSTVKGVFDKGVSFFTRSKTATEAVPPVVSSPVVSRSATPVNVVRTKSTRNSVVLGRTRSKRNQNKGSVKYAEGGNKKRTRKNRKQKKNTRKYLH